MPPASTFEAPRCVQQQNSVDAFPGAERLTNEQLFALDVDVLIPAALENQITLSNVSSIRAKIVVEGANSPTDPEAHHYLHEHGVFVVPDILANSAGVTASYFEWVQDRYGYFWTRGSQRSARGEDVRSVCRRRADIDEIPGGPAYGGVHLSPSGEWRP